MLNIDFDEIAKQLCPPLLRKPVQLAWRRLLVSQLKHLHEQIVLPFFAKTKKQMHYNDQTIMLEFALNEEFDPSTDTDYNRRIYIEHNDTPLVPTFLRNKSEHDATPTLSKVYLNNKTEGAAPKYWRNRIEELVPVERTINIPVVLFAQDRAIRAFIERYRTATSKYKIIYF